MPSCSFFSAADDASIPSHGEVARLLQSSGGAGGEEAGTVWVELKLVGGKTGTPYLHEMSSAGPDGAPLLVTKLEFWIEDPLFFKPYVKGLRVQFGDGSGDGEGGAVRSVGDTCGRPMDYCEFDWDAGERVRSAWVLASVGGGSVRSFGLQTDRQGCSFAHNSNRIPVQFDVGEGLLVGIAGTEKEGKIESLGWLMMRPKGD